MYGPVAGIWALSSTYSYHSNSFVIVGELLSSSASLLIQTERGKPDDLFLLCVTSKLIIARYLIHPLVSLLKDTEIISLKHQGYFPALSIYPCFPFHRLDFV